MWFVIVKSGSSTVDEKKKIMPNNGVHAHDNFHAFMAKNDEASLTLGSTGWWGLIVGPALGVGCTFAWPRRVTGDREQGSLLIIHELPGRGANPIYIKQNSRNNNENNRSLNNRNNNSSKQQGQQQRRQQQHLQQPKEQQQ